MLCQQYYRKGRIDPANDTFNIDPKIVTGGFWGTVDLRFLVPQPPLGPGEVFDPCSGLERVQGVCMGPRASLKVLLPPCRLPGSGPRGPTASSPRAGPQLQELHPQISQVIADAFPAIRGVLAFGAGDIPLAQGMGKGGMGTPARGLPHAEACCQDAKSPRWF